jgi:hypothetical protein
MLREGWRHRRRSRRPGRVSRLGVEGTWTSRGRLEFLLGYSRISFDPLAGTTNAYTGNQTGAQVSYLAVKQGARAPFSLQFGVGYSLLSYTGDAFQSLDVDGYGLTAAAAVGRRVELGSDLSLVPVLGFQRTRATITVEAGGMEVDREKTHATAWTGIIHIVSHGDVYIAPRIDLTDDGKPMYGVIAGFLFPHHR